MTVETWRTPTLAECEGAGIEPTEYAVLISMAQKLEKTAGGLILAAETVDKAQWGSNHARLVAVSPLAFTYANWPEGARKPQVGDVVFVGKYPGSDVIGRDGKTYHLCDDRSITGVMERAEAQQIEVRNAA